MVTNINKIKAIITKANLMHNSLLEVLLHFYTLNLNQVYIRQEAATKEILKPAIF